MNYRTLIQTAKKRGSDKSKIPYYTESHHIVPKCMGGKNTKENLVLLSAREHYVAHRLLSKMFPTHIGIQRALFNMCTTNTTENRNYIISANEYSYAREMFSKLQSSNMIKRWKSEEYRTNVSSKLSASGINAWNDVDKRKNIQNAQRAACNRPEVIERKRLAALKLNESQEYKNKLSIAAKEVNSRPEIKAKLKEFNRKSPIWNPTTLKLLHELWIKLDKPKRARFRTLAVKHGFPDENYTVLVNKYFIPGIEP